LLPALNDCLEPEAARILASSAQHIKFKAQDTLFAPGMACSGFIIIEAGRLRVLATAPNGRQIVLYHLVAGETCIVTTACLLANAKYEAEAQAETDGQALMLSKQGFERLLDSSPQFRRFVFEGFAQRLSLMMALMQHVVERRLDKRLAKFLNDNAPEFTGTQQDIAQELGTAREVVSRQLKQFETKGWIKIARGRIVIQRPKLLSKFSEDV